MENATKLFNYEGNKVAFRNHEGIAYANATEMAKPFGKRPIDWLENQNTNSFLLELSKVRNSTLTDLVKVKKGGNAPGTWMHEDVAIEFARWLSPAFAIWCNDRIKELLNHGFTATNDKLDELVNNPDLLIQLATELKKERYENEMKTFQLEKANEVIQQQAPKVKYHNEVLNAENTHTTTTIAKELGMSAKSLNSLLKSMGIQYFHDGHWVLYHKYQSKGFTKTKTHTYYGNDGVQRTAIQTVWTEKGREFIHRSVNTNLN